MLLNSKNVVRPRVYLVRISNVGFRVHYGFLWFSGFIAESTHTHTYNYFAIARSFRNCFIFIDACLVARSGSLPTKMLSEFYYPRTKLRDISFAVRFSANKPPGTIRNKHLCASWCRDTRDQRCITLRNFRARRRTTRV